MIHPKFLLIIPMQLIFLRVTPSDSLIVRQWHNIWHKKTNTYKLQDYIPHKINQLSHFRLTVDLILILLIPLD